MFALRYVSVVCNVTGLEMMLLVFRYMFTIFRNTSSENRGCLCDELL